MNKNLVICPAGDNSTHQSWNVGEKNFDTAILYYGNNESIQSEYQKTSKFFLKSVGEKGALVYNFILANYTILMDYEFVWIVDDYIESNCHMVNKLFYINKLYDLWLSQPSISGYTNYEIQKRNEDKILRFTNFVEVICPCFSLKTLLFLFHTYAFNYSSWGLDYLWPKLLSYPMNRIAIIDDVEVNHTRLACSEYGNRFAEEPVKELEKLFMNFNLTFNQKIYGSIFK